MIKCLSLKTNFDCIKWITSDCTGNTGYKSKAKIQCHFKKIDYYNEKNNIFLNWRKLRWCNVNNTKQETRKKNIQKNDHIDTPLLRSFYFVSMRRSTQKGEEKNQIYYTFALPRVLGIWLFISNHVPVALTSFFNIFLLFLVRNEEINTNIAI